MPTASALATTQIGDLVGLYLGDRDSLGYYQRELVAEICRRSNPSTFERLRTTVFGASPVIEDIDPIAYEVLGEGYEQWDRQGRPKGTAPRVRALP